MKVQTEELHKKEQVSTFFPKAIEVVKHKPLWNLWYISASAWAILVFLVLAGTDSPMTTTQFTLILLAFNSVTIILFLLGRDINHKKYESYLFYQQFYPSSALTEGEIIREIAMQAESEQIDSADQSYYLVAYEDNRKILVKKDDCQYSSLGQKVQLRYLSQQPEIAHLEP